MQRDGSKKIERLNAQIARATVLIAEWRADIERIRHAQESKASRVPKAIRAAYRDRWNRLDDIDLKATAARAYDIEDIEDRSKLLDMMELREFGE